MYKAIANLWSETLMDKIVSSLIEYTWYKRKNNYVGQNKASVIKETKLQQGARAVQTGRFLQIVYWGQWRGQIGAGSFLGRSFSSTTHSTRVNREHAGSYRCSVWQRSRFQKGGKNQAGLMHHSGLI